MRLRFTFVLSSLLFFSSCNETLPPRIELHNVISTQLTRVNTFTLEPITDTTMFIDPARLPDGMTFGFKIMNLYDDPLEDKSYIIANFILTPLNKPDYAFTKTIIDTSGYTVLRIDPGKPKWILYKWDFKIPIAASPKYFWEVLDAQLDRKYYFKLSGDVQVFRKVAMQRPSPVSFSISVR